MARIRTIKPSFFLDMDLARLPVWTRLTFIGLWTYADDDGRGVDEPRLIKAALWPLEDRQTLRRVDDDMKLLADGNHICRYSQVRGRFFHVVNWKHQVISHPQRSRIDPCGLPEHSRNVPGMELERSGSIPGGREGKGKEGISIPPHHLSSNGRAVDNSERMMNLE